MPKKGKTRSLEKPVASGITKPVKAPKMTSVPVQDYPEASPEELNEVGTNGDNVTTPQMTLNSREETIRSTGNHQLSVDGTERTPLQTERDSVASTMSKEWLDLELKAGRRARSSHDPRGIANPGCHCYWNSMLRNLMHIPIFLQWICTHIPTDDCLVYQDQEENESRADDPECCTRCEVKRLVEEYWGPKSLNYPIPENSPALLGLKSNAWKLTILDEERQEDAQEALLFLTNDEYGLAKGDDSWRMQFDTIFQLQNVPFNKCHRCGIEREHRGSLNNQLVVPVDDSHTTIEEAIDASFESHLEEWACLTEGCAGSIPDKCGPPQDGRWVIRAAPRVLIVQLLIFRYDPEKDRTWKITNALSIGDELDLTQYQEKGTIPLKYQLSGVVTHSGEGATAGHYVACVRGPGTDNFHQISDDTCKKHVSRKEFTANPQHAPIGDDNDPDYYVYMLTYTRDETSLDALERLNKSKERELVPRERQQAFDQISVNTSTWLGTAFDQISVNTSTWLGTPSTISRSVEW